MEWSTRHSVLTLTRRHTNTDFLGELGRYDGGIYTPHLLTLSLSAVWGRRKQNESSLLCAHAQFVNGDWLTAQREKGCLICDIKLLHVDAMPSHSVHAALCLKSHHIVM
jgi:hypothetical protein